MTHSLRELDALIKRRIGEAGGLEIKLCGSDFRFLEQALKSESRDWKELALLTLNRAIAQRIVPI